jgi:hypothetical protein
MQSGLCLGYNSRRMPTRPITDEEPDENEIAFAGIQELIRRDEARDASRSNGNIKSLKAAASGKLGGLKGGKARASSLTPERRKAIALKAARARWAKKR